MNHSKTFMSKLNNVDFDALSNWVYAVIRNSGHAWMVFDISELPPHVIKTTSANFALRAKHLEEFKQILNKKFVSFERPLVGISYDGITDISGYKSKGTECYVTFAPTKYLYRAKSDTVVVDKKQNIKLELPKLEEPPKFPSPEEVSIVLDKLTYARNTWIENKNYANTIQLFTVYIELIKYRKLTPEKFYAQCTLTDLNSESLLKAKKIKNAIKRLYQNHDNTIKI